LTPTARTRPLLALQRPPPIPTLIDPGADGNASDTTYTDILLSGFGIWWAFGVGVGVNGNLGPGTYDLAGDLSYELTVDADSTNPARPT
jgi:hypothetical protein